MDPKLKVFLSSAQFNEEFSVEREGLPILFTKEPLSSIFILWEIEDHASPERVSDFFSSHVKDSDLLILLLGQTIRPAVRQEYAQALKSKIPVWAFVRSQAAPDDEMKSFVNVLHADVTTAKYAGLKDLCKKIEDSLLQYYYRNPSHRSFRGDRIADPFQQTTSKADEERAIRLLVGILDTKSAENTKDTFLSGLVLQALSHYDKPLTKENIIEKLSSLLGQKNLPFDSEIFTTISQLSLEDLLDEKPGGYVLTESAKKKLLELDTEMLKTEEKMFSSIYQANGEIAQSMTLRSFISTASSALGQVIYSTALLCVSAQSTGEFDATQFDSDELHRMCSAALVDCLEDTSSISRWQSILIEFLQSGDSQAIIWLNRTFRAYWCLAAIGLDPSCISFKKKEISKYSIYVDSHIAIRAMVAAGSDSALCSDLTSLGKDAGVDMRLSYGLFQEVEAAFSQINKLYYASGQDISRAIGFLQKIGRRYDILEGYVHELSTNKKVKWESYINRYYSPVDPSKLRGYIEHELGIAIEEEKEFSIEQWKKINDMTNLLLRKRGVSMYHNL